MSAFLDRLGLCLSDDLAWIHLCLGLQCVLYFLAGRAVYAAAMAPRRAAAPIQSPYTAAYVILGAMAWHFLTFLVMFAGLRSIWWGHVLAFLPFLAVSVWRPRLILNFPKSWAFLLLVLATLIFLPIGTGLYHAQAQNWDEFTHWASRAKLIYLLDRLPNAADPVACVTPSYGLYATLVAVWSYSVVGREVVGVATAWSFLFALLVAVHLYEHLRVRGVSMLLAGPLCTWFLAELARNQRTTTLSMYADVYVLAGGALALLHLAELLRQGPGCEGAREDGLLAAGGLAILFFTKSTADITAACAILYFACYLAARGLRLRRWRVILNGAALVFLTLLPAIVVRGAWWGYMSWGIPPVEELALQQGHSDVLAAMWNANPQEPLLRYLGQTVQKLYAAQPYQLLLIMLPICWLADILLRRATPHPTPAKSLSLLSLWMPLLLLGFVGVSYLVYARMGAERAAANTHRYLIAGLPATLCYVAAVVHRFISWAFSDKRMVSGSKAIEITP